VFGKQTISYPTARPPRSFQRSTCPESSTKDLARPRFFKVFFAYQDFCHGSQIVFQDRFSCPLLNTEFSRTASLHEIFSFLKHHANHRIDILFPTATPQLEQWEENAGLFRLGGPSAS
jgi:hypothetical protein